MSSPQNDKLLQEVTALAATDLAFRKRLLSNPEAAIFDVFGVQLPASGPRVRFIEKPAGIDVLIVLPDVQRSGEELDDEDLDAAAGGTAGPGDTW
jgi:hypothetical protein